VPTKRKKARMQCALRNEEMTKKKHRLCDCKIAERGGDPYSMIPAKDPKIE